MRYEVALPGPVHRRAADFLLQHHRKGERQEDLCFALWRPSTGTGRTTAIVFDLVLPKPGERELHGNASFAGAYLTRAVRRARETDAGLALLHNHLKPGWQPLSEKDETAERDRVAPAARTAGHPAVGLTLGTNEAWSARFWVRDGGRFRQRGCEGVRIVGRRFRVTRGPNRQRADAASGTLVRTVSTWGPEAHADLASVRAGIVGVGSVGAIIAETLARMGTEHLVLIDPDRLEAQNLDRFLPGTRRGLGLPKVHITARRLRRVATARKFRVDALDRRVEEPGALRAALDCDLLFVAVDRPLPKDLLNQIAYAHCIPLVFGGVYASNKANGRLAQATWTVLPVGPERRCLRCDGQYTTTEVTMERDGSLDDPRYLRDLAGRAGGTTGQNVFPYSVHLASSMVLEMVRMVIGEDWWNDPGGKLRFDFLRRRLTSTDESCMADCPVQQRTGLGNRFSYPFLSPSPASCGSLWNRLRARFRRARRTEPTTPGRAT